MLQCYILLLHVHLAHFHCFFLISLKYFDGLFESFFTASAPTPPPGGLSARSPSARHCSTSSRRSSPWTSSSSGAAERLSWSLKRGSGKGFKRGPFFGLFDFGWGGLVLKAFCCGSCLRVVETEFAFGSVAFGLS